MDKKKLEQLKKRLEERQQELRRQVSNREQDGRNQGEDVAQDIADRAASSYTKEFLFTQSTNERQLLGMVDSASGSHARRHLCRMYRLRKRDQPEATGSSAVDALLHRMPGEAGKRPAGTGSDVARSLKVLSRRRKSAAFAFSKTRGNLNLRATVPVYFSA